MTNSKGGAGLTEAIFSKSPLSGTENNLQRVQYHVQN